jgi:hypothetical protein
VHVTRLERGFRTEVRVGLTADEDYDVVSEIGYRTGEGEPLVLIDLMLADGWDARIVFESEQRPVYIELDPMGRVPQADTSNDVWSQSAAWSTLDWRAWGRPGVLGQLDHTSDDR